MSGRTSRRWGGIAGVSGFVALLFGLARWQPAIVSAAFGLQAPAEDADRSLPAPSTQRMAARLANLKIAENPQDNPFDSIGRVDMLRSMLANGNAGYSVESLTMSLAIELLNSGQPELARQTMDTLLAAAALQTPDTSAQNTFAIREFGALCDLRIGERDNCVLHHGVESCLVPIKGSGIHSDQRGSRAAIATYRELLAQQPDNMSLRWLLNIAAMTVGEYPESVPAEFLIPPAVFASENDIGRFHDVAPFTGLSQSNIAGGSIVDDFDGDGLLDVVTSAMGLSDPMHYFHNNGDGTFTDRTEAAGLSGIVGGLNIVQADYNNDGSPDILVLRGAWLHKAGRLPNSLLRNRGDGTFEDVTEEAGLLSFHPTQVGVWGDYDNDGWLDLFIGNESDVVDPNPSELWHNNQDGTFTNRIELLGSPFLGFVKGAAWGDYDNDGRPDLLVTGMPAVKGMAGMNRLFHNDGPRGLWKSGAEWNFTDVTAKAGITAPQSAFSTWFWDYDNDGWPDIFIAGYKPVPVGEIAMLYLGLPNDNELPRLYHNNHDGSFSDVTHAAKLDRVALTMGANFGDLDNDGWLDLYANTGGPDFRLIFPSRMFRNAGGTSFEDVTTSGGFGHIQKGHGVSFADIDNDGDQDVFAEMGGAYTADTAHNVLYENPGHPNHWITLRLEGRTSNRSAIGARLRFHVKTDDGERDIYSVVSSGGSFGVSPLRREIGLGDARELEYVEVSWPQRPGRRPQVLSHVAMDRAYLLVEGEGGLRDLALPRYTLARAK